MIMAGETWIVLRKLRSIQATPALVPTVYTVCRLPRMTVQRSMLATKFPVESAAVQPDLILLMVWFLIPIKASFGASCC